jgi:hypothetical protein
VFHSDSALDSLDLEGGDEAKLDLVGITAAVVALMG